MGQAIIFMEEATQVEWVRGDLFRITDPNTGTVRMAEAAVVAECIANAARSYAAYRQRQSAEIIPLFKDAEAAH